MANEEKSGPFHETVIPRLENDTKERVLGFLELLGETHVPENHNNVLEAINGAFEKHNLRPVDYESLIKKIVVERAEAEKKEAGKIWSDAQKASTRLVGSGSMA